jgi:hypothetical protein
MGRSPGMGGATMAQSFRGTVAPYLLDTIGPLANHTIFLLYHDRPSSDHIHACLADRELHFLHVDPRH